MIPTLKSEFRKLLTVRSTYIITILVALFLTFIAFYVEGWRLKPHELADPGELASDVFGALTLSIFGAIVAVLLMTHEYRYNTILYTVINSKSRSRVLLSKIIVIGAYAIFLTLLLGILSPLMSWLGASAAGHSMSPQTLPWGDLAWRSLYYGWAYGMAGLLLAVLIRNQIGAIVAIFIVPTIVEGLLAQLLSTKAVYLPFNSLSQVIGDSNIPVSGNQLRPGKAALVFLMYLIVGWAVAWILFLKRDATKLD